MSSFPPQPPPRRQQVRSRDPVESALAAVTAWLHDDRDLGRTIAAAAIDDDPIGFLDAVGGLWLIVGDVAREQQVDIRRVVADIALGVAQAANEEPHPRTDQPPIPPSTEEA